MTSKSDIQFPLDGLPQDLHMAKLMGLYPQRQDGLWMQRVRVQGGRLTGAQWKALAGIARDFTPATPLHLTTRQDLELHNLTAERVGPVQKRLAEAGLSTVGGGGDTLRNIIVCPCAGNSARVPDLLPLAAAIRNVLEEYENIYALPRKFKVSLSACAKACGQPWISDLGLVALEREGQWGFQVIAAGSLGAKPAIGLLCFEWLPASDVLPLSLAAVRLFDARGDRENRTKARLRHVRQRVGDEAFLAMLREELAKARAERAWPAVALTLPAAGLGAWATLAFPNGDVWPDAAEALGQLADQADVRVVVTASHQVLLFGRDERSLRDALVPFAALQEAAQPAPRIIACPGTRWCKRGIADTNAMADRIRRQLGATIPHGVMIAISGCPNGCAHSAVADIGLTGLLVNWEGQKVEGFSLVRGGGRGRDGRLAQPIGSIPSDEVPARIGHVLP